MIYGDNPQTINERQDALGLRTYTAVPQISAIAQAGNLYVYCVNNPVRYNDLNGEIITEAAIFTLLDLIRLAVTGTTIIAMASDPNVQAATRDWLSEAKKGNTPTRTNPAASTGGSSPASPPPPGNGNNGGYKRYTEKEIERKYSLKEGQFHRDIKQEILKDVKKMSAKEFRKIGDNPDIYLMQNGRIGLASRSGLRYFISTDLYIQMYLP